MGVCPRLGKQRVEGVGRICSETSMEVLSAISHIARCHMASV